MNLLIDIGNTNTSIAVTKGTKFLKKYFIHTSKKEISRTSFQRLLGKYVPGIDQVVIVSVVPEFFSILRKALKDVAPGKKVLVVGKDVKVPIKNLYKKPGEVGQDRLVTAFAALKKYKAPLVTVDFGTAVTMDYVNKKGEYEGGLIFPGLRLALGSLVKHTALLPHINIKPTRGFVGKDTRGSMNNGIIFGYAALCDGLVEQFRKKYGSKLKVVATGGDARFISKYSRQIKTVSPDLIFEGLLRLL